MKNLNTKIDNNSYVTKKIQSLLKGFFISSSLFMLTACLQTNLSSTQEIPVHNQVSTNVRTTHSFFNFQNNRLTLSQQDEVTQLRREINEVTEISDGTARSGFIPPTFDMDKFDTQRSILMEAAKKSQDSLLTQLKAETNCDNNIELIEKSSFLFETTMGIQINDPETGEPLTEYYSISDHMKSTDGRIRNGEPYEHIGLDFIVYNNKPIYNFLPACVASTYSMSEGYNQYGNHAILHFVLSRSFVKNNLEELSSIFDKNYSIPAETEIEDFNKQFFSDDDTLIRFSLLIAHMKNPPEVKEGHFTFPGEILGEMGKTGKAFGNHVHTELKPGFFTLKTGTDENGEPVNNDNWKKNTPYLPSTSLLYKFYGEAEEFFFTGKEPGKSELDGDYGPPILYNNTYEPNLEVLVETPFFEPILEI